MSPRSIGLTQEVWDYLTRVSLRETDVMRELREETQAHEMARMQISPEQGQFMALLARLVGAKRAVEIGTFTGYSALAVAQMLPEDGELIACDVSREYTSIAERYWQRAGVSDRIDLRLQPALETLAELLDEGTENRFDFAFIDADKVNYDAYYEACLKLVRSGGLVTIDNALWGGDVADPSVDDEDTNAIRALNEKIGTDDRVFPSLVPIGDGLMVCRVR